MAGGPTTPQLVGVSSESGALGSLGAAYLQPDDITKQVAAIRVVTSKPFAVNLFVPNPLDGVEAAAVDAAVNATRTFRDTWGLTPPRVAPPFDIPFDAQFEAVIAARPAVLSFVFGMLGAQYIRAARQQGVRVFGAATSVEEALHMDASGVHAT